MEKKVSDIQLPDVNFNTLRNIDNNFSGKKLSYIIDSLPREPPTDQQQTAPLDHPRWNLRNKNCIVLGNINRIRSTPQIPSVNAVEFQTIGDCIDFKIDTKGLPPRPSTNMTRAKQLSTQHLKKSSIPESPVFKKKINFKMTKKLVTYQRLV